MARAADLTADDDWFMYVNSSSADWPGMTMTGITVGVKGPSRIPRRTEWWGRRERARRRAGAYIRWAIGSANSTAFTAANSSTIETTGVATSRARSVSPCLATAIRRPV